MVTTDGSWQDITASYVRSEQPVEYRGHEQVRRDSLQDGGLPPPVPRPQGPRRALPRPPLPIPPVETLNPPVDNVEESLLDVSSDSWATLPSDNPLVADTSTESIGPVLPGAFKNSSMSQSINNQSSFTPRHSQFALHPKREEENEDPFLTDSLSNRPLSATSNATDSTVESDWVPPIASSSSTPKKSQTKLRQHAVRSPRSARPAPPASDYIVSRSMRSPASSAMRSLDPHATPRRRKGSSVSREDSPEPRAPRRRQKRESSWLPIAKGGFRAFHHCTKQSDHHCLIRHLLPTIHCHQPSHHDPGKNRWCSGPRRYQVDHHSILLFRCPLAPHQVTDTNSAECCPRCIIDRQPRSSLVLWPEVSSPPILQHHWNWLLKRT